MSSCQNSVGGDDRTAAHKAADQESVGQGGHVRVAANLGLVATDDPGALVDVLEEHGHIIFRLGGQG